MTRRATPAPPAVTAAGKHAIAAWKDLCAGVEDFELSPTRRAGFEALAVQIARMRTAAEQVKDEGLTITDDDGVQRPHPALAVERAAQSEIREWTRHLT